MAETPVKETPVEETPVEEAPAEEAKTEETPAEEAKTEEPPKKFNKKAVAFIAVVLAVGVAVSVYFFRNRKDPDDGRIPYAQGVVLLGDGGDIEPEEVGWINLTYNYKAFSSDGVNFSCLLTNNAANLYDLYFDIYADDAFQDQIFLSGLIPPGYGLTEIMLNHALPAGTTSCYVVFNQVDTDEDGNQSIVNQMMVTVDFVVE